MSEESIQQQRHSARAFKQQDVPEDVVKAVVADALNAPSWENSQPGRIYVATGATAAKLRAHHERVVTSGQKSWAEVVPPKQMTGYMGQNVDDWLASVQDAMGPKAMQDFGSAGARLFDAPVLVYITVPKDATMYAAYDAGALGYGILLAATAHGLSSVPAYQLIRYPEEIRAQFDIPDDEEIMMGMALGYPDDSQINQLRTTRQRVDDVLQLRK